MPYKVTFTQTKPDDFSEFFIMPAEHVAEVDAVIATMPDKVLDFSWAMDELVLTTTRTFIDEAAYQEFLDKSSTKEAITTARAQRAEWNKFYNIIEETKTETI